MLKVQCQYLNTLELGKLDDIAKYVKKSRSVNSRGTVESLDVQSRGSYCPQALGVVDQTHDTALHDPKDFAFLGAYGDTRGTPQDVMWLQNHVEPLLN